MSGKPVLSVEGLRTYFHQFNGVRKAVDGVDFTVQKQRVLGLVGESGCGKSMTARSIMQLVPRPHGKIEGGKILFRRPGADSDAVLDLASLDPFGSLMRSVRGNEIGMIFQEPMTSLNPVFTIGQQISESLRLHKRVNRRTAKEMAIEILERTRMPNPRATFDRYPHELSGGMRQRAMIAIALSCEIRLLIADEPTTALDVTIQSKILDLIMTLQNELGMSVIMITHDLGVIAEISDDVAVMYLGRIVEHTDVVSAFSEPLHPYLQGLLKSIPSLSFGSKRRLEPIPGSVPDDASSLRGCKFAPRCPFAMSRCWQDEPPMFSPKEGHHVRCWLYDD